MRIAKDREFQIEGLGNLAKTLSELREEKGYKEKRKISQMTASMEMSLHPGYMSCLETLSNTNPTLDKLIRIAKYYEIPLSRMLGRAGL